jgi:hypothetical protein
MRLIEMRNKHRYRDKDWELVLPGPHTTSAGGYGQELPLSGESISK